MIATSWKSRTLARVYAIKLAADKNDGACGNVAARCRLRGARSPIFSSFAEYQALEGEALSSCERKRLKGSQDQFAGDFQRLK